MPERWDQDVEDLVSDEIGMSVWDRDGQREATRRVLTALADADLLAESAYCVEPLKEVPDGDVA